MMARNPQNSRDGMTEFWKIHSKEASAEEMMLDTKADYLTTIEAPEILSLLPSIKGKRVLELGAGIGRFTGEIAKYAGSVVAVDFMDTFIKKNEELNGHLRNIQFLQADVTQLKLSPNRFDVIFSNWLFMYLSDEESIALMDNILCWLDDDGYFFFRESCFHQSGDRDRNNINPTIYRSPTLYNNILESTVLVNNQQLVTHRFNLIFTKNIQAYITIKNNKNQLCWLMQKKEEKSDVPHGYKTFQEFLDNQQYSRNGILRYEKVFGKHFVSTGGIETTKEFVEILDLKPGQNVLDIGCGIGGSAFYMAEHHDVTVMGIDLSSNMIDIAKERLGSNSKVTFEIADATKTEFENGSFDVVYSRDTILHIKDKNSLFERFLKWLKPGGKVLISDYCCKDGQWSDDFTNYVEQRGYNLLSATQYGKVLESAGFVNVRAQDKTDMFTTVLQKELEKTKKIKEEYIQEFSKEDYDAIINGWSNKLKRCAQGDQKWGLFYAEKPQ